MAAAAGSTSERPCEACGEPVSTPRSFSDSVTISAAPQVVYDLLTDISRTGEWSPICVGCEWEDGQGLAVGSWFAGHNRTGADEWTTRSQVEVVEPGRAFGWGVNGGLVGWSYTIEPAGEGTRLTESWEFRPAGIAMFHEKWGSAAHERIDLRTGQALAGIPETLAAIKRVAESA